MIVRLLCLIFLLMVIGIGFISGIVLATLDKKDISVIIFASCGGGFFLWVLLVFLYLRVQEPSTVCPIADKV